MKIIEEFGINPTLLLAQTVNFAILLFFLKLFLYKPLLKALGDRKTKIAKSLQEAEEIEKRLNQTKEEQEAILEKARIQASDLMSEAKKEAKELYEKMLAETKTTVEDMIKRSEERMRLEKEQMITEAKKDLATLVVEATTKVTQKTMDSEGNRRLVEETVKEVSKK